MNPRFTDDFLIKSLAALVNEEGQRIVDSNLASIESLKKHISAELNDSKDLLKSLSALHVKLAAIKLPEDTSELEVEEEMREELEEFIEKDEEIGQLASIVFDTLSKIASLMGAKGNHEAAYKIERAIEEMKNA